MKYQCDIPGFEDCFVEISERWTRKELRLYFSAKGDEYVTFMQTKISSIYLETTGEPIDEPGKLTLEASEDVDIALWKWLSTALTRGVDDMLSLGEAHARRWLSEQDKLTTAPDNQTQS